MGKRPVSGDQDDRADVGPPVEPILIRIREAARRSGAPVHFIRKTFMSPTKKSRPKNCPPPPPHKRIGRVIYIIAALLPAWIAQLPGDMIGPSAPRRKRRGAPTKAERIAKRQAALQGQLPGDTVGPSPSTAPLRKRRGGRTKAELIAKRRQAVLQDE